MKKIVLFMIVNAIVMNIALSQGVSINATGTVADNSAIIDASSTTQGQLIPRMTTVQRNSIVNPANSLLIFNTDYNCFQAYINGQWQNLYCDLGCTAAPTEPGAITGNQNLCYYATGITYYIQQVAGATSYNWSVPTGATIIAGQGTAGIVVDFGTSSGDVSVSASNNCGIGNAQTLAVTLSSVTASVSISANPSGAICAGTNVDFTATPVNGGASPVYQWKLNGGNVGLNSPAYSNSSLVNGDNIVCVMTSNASCVTGSPATSNQITMTVNSPVAASVSITANPSGTICEGTNVLFTATPTNGGSSPTYQWKKGGAPIGGATNSTYSYNPANGDVISCEMTSNAACVTGSPCTSNQITETVVSPPTTATNGSTQTICSTGNATLSGNNPAAGTGAWTVVSGPSTSPGQFGNTGVYNTTFTPAGGAGSYVVRWTISNAPCTPSYADATITVKAPPTTATNTSTQTICTTGSATLSGNNPATGTGAWTVVSGPSTSSGQFGNTGVYNTTFTPAGGPGNYVVRWTISNAPCTPSYADATITVSGPCSQTFYFTGSMQTFTVPTGVTCITIDAYGAQGQENSWGGKGGQAKGTYTTTGGTTLYVYVGGNGSGTNGGWNGGESSPNGSGCNATTGGTGFGGGASDVRAGGTALANRIIVAGGGGGRGQNGPSNWNAGGAGGGNVGAAGTTNGTATGGGGGTQSGGGAAGTGTFGSGGAGALGTGGDRCPGDYLGGDGGGGYYGGGGGGGSSGSLRGGGGGGSNYLGGVTPILNNQGIQGGDGMIIISW